MSNHGSAGPSTTAGARHAFGRPIKGHSTSSKRLVDIKIRIETSRCIAYAALDRLVAGHPEASLMCSIAKLVGTEGLWATAQDAMMLFGHAGYEEGEVARLPARPPAARASPAAPATSRR